VEASGLLHVSSSAKGLCRGFQLQVILTQGEGCLLSSSKDPSVYSMLYHCEAPKVPDRGV